MHPEPIVVTTDGGLEEHPLVLPPSDDGSGVGWEDVGKEMASVHDEEGAVEVWAARGEYVLEYSVDLVVVDVFGRSFEVHFEVSDVGAVDDDVEFLEFSGLWCWLFGGAVVIAFGITVGHRSRLLHDPLLTPTTTRPHGPLQKPLELLPLPLSRLFLLLSIHKLLLPLPTARIPRPRSVLLDLPLKNDGFVHTYHIHPVAVGERYGIEFGPGKTSREERAGGWVDVNFCGDLASLWCCGLWCGRAQ